MQKVVTCHFRDDSSFDLPLDPVHSDLAQLISAELAPRDCLLFPPAGFEDLDAVLVWRNATRVTFLQVYVSMAAKYSLVGASLSKIYNLLGPCNDDVA